MHLLKTDLEYGKMETTGRKSVTLLASGYNFNLKRVVRSPWEKKIKEGLLKYSTPSLTEVEFGVLHEKRELATENLVSWPPQHPLAKFTVRRFTSLYYLTAIDERSTDSYFLKTATWEHVERALLDLTGGTVHLPDPLILEWANPFACYAPFDAPSWDHFENVNNKIKLELSNAIASLEADRSGGYLSPKLSALYLRLLADVEELDELPALIPPPKSHFE